MNIHKTETELKSRIDNLKINGYHLPKSMINRIKNDKWKIPSNLKYLKNLIITNCPIEIEKKLLNQMIDNFSLFSLVLMKSESENLVKWLDSKWGKDRVTFFEKKDNQIYPGDIEHDKVILIADFGHGSDTCIALDYKENKHQA